MSATIGLEVPSRKRLGELYRNWGDRLSDHFRCWIKDREMSMEELMILDQFLHNARRVRILVEGEKIKTLQAAIEMADDNTLEWKGS